MRLIRIFLIASILLIPLSAFAKKERASYEAFEKTYYNDIYSNFLRAYSHGMTEHAGFLILGLTSPNRDHYVQCHLYDDTDSHASRIYCEAASGFYSNRKLVIPKESFKAIKKEGFDMNGNKGNFSLDMPCHGIASIKKATGILLRTLYFGYGADIGNVILTAPLVPHDLLFKFDEINGVKNIKKLVSQIHFKHKWKRKECDEWACQIESEYNPPYPFSDFYPWEAAMNIYSLRNDEKTPKTLRGILNREIAELRKSEKIEEYLEEDRRKPKDNIASWVDKTGKKPVGYIKFRSSAKDFYTLPSTVIAAIVQDRNVTYYAYVSIAFAEHDDEIKTDLKSIVEQFLN